ncbi:MAG: thioredoxin family protein [Rikenellaceae bacterium]|nr:thioredoxin family protein [Rikenellaceae bacterium]MCL2692488.1 thioredoxin family protein [Rikenellaceae bacterium]
MKKILLIALLSLFAATTFAQGINFEDLSLPEALAKARAENKLVFVNCTTSWCGPCKVLAAEVFPRQEVGDYFNPRFVSITLDMEKGDNPPLREKYGMIGYPTLLVLNPDGELIHKMVIFPEVEMLLAQIPNTYDPDKAYGRLKRQFDEGRADKEFLLNCVRAFVLAFEPDNARKALDKLEPMMSDEDRFSADLWIVYTNDRVSPRGSDNENFLFDNYSRFCRYTGFSEVMKEITRRYNNHMRDIISNPNRVTPMQLNSMIERFGNMGCPDWNTMRIYSLFAIAAQGDIDDIIIRTQKEYKSFRDAEDILFVYQTLTRKVMPMGTPEQKTEWKRLGELISDSVPDGEEKDKLNILIGMMKENM